MILQTHLLLENLFWNWIWFFQTIVIRTWPSHTRITTTTKPSAESRFETFESLKAAKTFCPTSTRQRSGGSRTPPSKRLWANLAKAKNWKSKSKKTKKKRKKKKESEPQNRFVQIIIRSHQRKKYWLVRTSSNQVFLVWLGLAKLDDAVFLAFETTKMSLSRPFVQNFSFRISWSIFKCGLSVATLHFNN